MYYSLTFWHKHSIVRIEHLLFGIRSLNTSNLLVRISMRQDFPFHKKKTFNYKDEFQKRIFYIRLLRFDFLLLQLDSAISNIVEKFLNGSRMKEAVCIYKTWYLHHNVIRLKFTGFPAQCIVIAKGIWKYWHSF